MQSLGAWLPVGESQQWYIKRRHCHGGNTKWGYTEPSYRLLTLVIDLYLVQQTSPCTHRTICIIKTVESNYDSVTTSKKITAYAYCYAPLCSHPNMKLLCSKLRQHNIVPRVQRLRGSCKKINVPQYFLHVGTPFTSTS